jgi:hypothetical protein
MNMTRLTIFILGLTAAVVPAGASLSYQSSQTTFSNQATVTDDLTLSSLITFTGVLSQFGSVANDEYVDPTTGVEFIAFNSNGTANKAFSSVSGGVLSTALNQGDTIEVILPAGVYGVAANFTTAFPSGVTLCMDPTSASFSSCDSGGTFIVDGGSGFVGTLNDNPTPAPMTTIWLNPEGGSEAGTDLQSFEIATQGDAEAPEVATMLMLGSGLIFIALLRRRTRLFGFLNG